MLPIIHSEMSTGSEGRVAPPPAHAASDTGLSGSPPRSVARLARELTVNWKGFSMGCRTARPATRRGISARYVHGVSCSAPEFCCHNGAAMKAVYPPVPLS
jgi:hypothetical protein